ncbi:MAG: B12-binding domain-containing radical SAM protein [bacterium]
MIKPVVHTHSQRTSVVFMTPPVTLEERYGALAASGSCTPCLASLILAALVRKAGYTVGVIDAAAEGLTFTEALERLEPFQPKLIAFTTTTLTTLPADRFARMAKDRWQDLIAAIGGPHATAIPEETLQVCPALDIAAVNEGERTILQILEAVEKGERDFSGIHGVVYRDRDGGIGRTPPPQTFKDLDSLPFPAWDLLPGFPQNYSPGYFKVRQLPSTSFVSSRGCPFECSFCDTSVFGQKIRSHSAEYMVDLFEYLNRRFGIRDVTFEDDTFMVYRKNVERFCELLLSKDLKMTWACNSRVNLAKPDLLRTMREAGCWHISYGIESGSQMILDHEDKKVTLEQIADGICNTAKAGIAPKGFFIVGHPRETRETLHATYNLTQSLPFADISVTCMTPFPGSPLARTAHEFGAFENDWTRMNLLNPIFIPHGLTQDDLTWWLNKILRDFYFRPRTVYSYMMRVLKNPSPQFLKGLARSAYALTLTVLKQKRNGAAGAALSRNTGVCS